MKKVLYLSYDGLTDPLGQSQVLPYLCYLSAQGYQFTILSFEKKARLESEGGTVQAIAEKAGIRWVPLSFTANPPVLAKAWDRWRMKRVAFALHQKTNFDLVHCRSYVAAEVGMLLKDRYGVKMLFDMRGFWADEKVDNGQWNQQRFFYRQLYRFYKRREQAFLLGADAIISLTAAAKDHLLQQAAYQHLSITVIPCCADLDHFDYLKVDPAAVQQLRLQLGLQESHKVLVYPGSVGGWYMTREMFRFFKALHHMQPQYRMLVLTPADPGRVMAEAAAEGVAPESIIISYASRERLPLFLAASHCSVFFIKNSFSKMASSPTKHAELMGMGLPVICNAIGDTGNIITETGTGLLVEQFDNASLEQAAAEVGRLEQLDKAHIRNGAFRYFDLQEGGARYAAIYRQLLAPPQQLVKT